MASVLATVEQLSPELRKEYWFSPEQQEESRCEYIAMLRLAKHRIKILCGEMDPDFYERDDLIGAVDGFLKSNSQVIVAFGKEGQDLSEMRDIFKQENPRWWDLREANPDKLHLYWACERPETHYTLVDGLRCFVEARHKKGETRATLFRSDPSFTRAMEKRFDSAVEAINQNKL